MLDCCRIDAAVDIVGTFIRLEVGVTCGVELEAMHQAAIAFLTRQFNADLPTHDVLPPNEPVLVPNLDKMFTNPEGLQHPSNAQS